MVSDSILIISGPRGSGRTTALIKWALEDPPNRVILVADEQRANNLRQVRNHISLGWRSWPHHFPIWTMNNSLALGAGRHPTLQVGIDDYDKLPSLALPFPVDWMQAVTLESGIYRNLPRLITSEQAIAGLQQIAEDLS